VPGKASLKVLRVMKNVQCKENHFQDRLIARLNLINRKRIQYRLSTHNKACVRESEFVCAAKFAVIGDRMKLSMNRKCYEMNL
jgi:hypothetical protein